MERFGWRVSLTNPDLEALRGITDTVHDLGFRE